MKIVNSGCILMHSNCMGSPGYEKYNFSVKSPGQLPDLADHLYSSGLNSIARHRFKLYWLGFAEQSKKRERFSLSPTAVLKSIACNSKPVSYVIPESTPCFLPGDHRPQGDPQGLLSPWPCSAHGHAPCNREPKSLGQAIHGTDTLSQQSGGFLPAMSAGIRL